MNQKISKDRIVYAVVIYIFYAHENHKVDALEDRITYAQEIFYFMFMTRLM